TKRPRGKPPIPNATSSPSEPVDMQGMAARSESPIRITVPLPNCRSIWASAACSAFSLFASINFTLSEPDSNVYQHDCLSLFPLGLSLNFLFRPHLKRPDVFKHKPKNTVYANSYCVFVQYRSTSTNNRAKAIFTAFSRTSCRLPEIWWHSLSVPSGCIQANHTVPTGFVGVPPPGPAIPLTATLKRDDAFVAAPSAMALTTSSLTAPCRFSNRSSTPKRRCLA